MACGPGTAMQRFMHQFRFWSSKSLQHVEVIAEKVQSEGQLWTWLSHIWTAHAP